MVAGCASARAPAPAPAPSAATAPLATSLAQAGGRAWAIVAMGGSAADDNSFWEVFTRPLGSTQWALVTPPGVADNGGLIAAVPPAAQGLDVAVRPSQDLTFSPLALTGNGGKTWDTGLVDASVAAVPDALALGGGRMLVLLGDGAIDQAATSGAGIPGEGVSGAAPPSASAAAWTRLAAPGAIAGSAAGRDCHVTAVTAVSLTAAGTPLVGASCARPGIAGIFAPAGSGWRAAGPALTGRLAGEPVRVLRLTADGGAGTMALLQSGTGDGDRGPTSLLAAWTADGTHWTVFAAASGARRPGPVVRRRPGRDGGVGAAGRRPRGDHRRARRPRRPRRSGRRLAVAARAAARHRRAGARAGRRARRAGRVRRQRAHRLPADPGRRVAADPGDQRAGPARLVELTGQGKKRWS